MDGPIDSQILQINNIHSRRRTKYHVYYKTTLIAPGIVKKAILPIPLSEILNTYFI